TAEPEPGADLSDDSGSDDAAPAEDVTEPAEQLDTDDAPTSVAPEPEQAEGSTDAAVPPPAVPPGPPNPYADAPAPSLLAANATA
ncbi:dihydrolipoamide succinyltransferase, partial [Mycobacterium sp. ITM-2017-0098]